MSEHPADQGHTFRITVALRGSSKVVGDKHYRDSVHFDELQPVEVRAWSLREALGAAFELPLSAWFEDEEESND